MSEMRYKSGLMANIPSLRDEDEDTIYRFFESRGVYPVDIQVESEIYYDLYYESDVGQYSCLMAGKQVYVTYLIADSYSLDTLVTPMSQIKRIAKVMQKKFNGSNISLYNYEWYTGTDEPCVVDCRFTREETWMM